jgi:hypothetical protein
MEHTRFSRRAGDEPRAIWTILGGTQIAASGEMGKSVVEELKEKTNRHCNLSVLSRG